LLSPFFYVVSPQVSFLFQNNFFGLDPGHDFGNRKADLRKKSPVVLSLTYQVKVNIFISTGEL